MPLPAAHANARSPHLVFELSHQLRALLFMLCAHTLHSQLEPRLLAGTCCSSVRQSASAI